MGQSVPSGQIVSLDKKGQIGQFSQMGQRRRMGQINPKGQKCQKVHMSQNHIGERHKISQNKKDQ